MLKKKNFQNITSLLFLAFTLLTAMPCQGKLLREMWISMPDSLSLLLNKNMRLEMVELQDMKVKSEVNNALGEVSVLDTLTADFAQVRLGKACTWQMKLLPLEQQDSVLCLVRTFAGPEKESDVLFFDQQWQPLETDRFFPTGALGGMEDRLLLRPDTMTEARFAELKAMVEPVMVAAVLFEHENAIVFRLALPLLSTEDKEKLNAIKMQRKFNWNEGKFNES